PADCWCKRDLSPTRRKRHLGRPSVQALLLRMRRISLTLVIAALVVLGWLAWGYGREFVTVDSCLDSSGSFDYSTMTCDHTANHPYSPYAGRHPAVTSIAV